MPLDNRMYLLFKMIIPYLLVYLQIGKYRREREVGKDKLFEELKTRNHFLERKLESTQRQLTRELLRKQVGSFGGQREIRCSHFFSILIFQGSCSEATEEASAVEDKLEKSHVEVIKISEKNLELRFELEKCKVDVSKLKNRTMDLEKLVEVMKSEQTLGSAGESLRVSHSHSILNLKVKNLDNGISNMFALRRCLCRNYIQIYM